MAISEEQFSVLECYMVWKVKSVHRSNYAMPDNLFQKIKNSLDLDPLDHEQIEAWISKGMPLDNTQMRSWEFFVRMLSMALQMREKLGPWDRGEGY